jgi:hypothetical protein
MVRIGKAAERILMQAEALKTRRQRFIKPLELPGSKNLVMFDLEGLPPQRVTSAGMVTRMRQHNGYSSFIIHNFLVDNLGIIAYIIASFTLF